MEVTTMLNFTTNTEKYTTASTRTHSAQFTQYASKKQLANANVLENEALEFLLAIKNTFSFAVHNNLQYVAITLYYANTKNYGFLVVDLHNKAVAEVASIKQAKQEILQLVNEQ
jgi:ribonuclease HIII